MPDHEEAGHHPPVATYMGTREDGSRVVTLRHDHTVKIRPGSKFEFVDPNDGQTQTAVAGNVHRTAPYVTYVDLRWQ